MVTAIGGRFQVSRISAATLARVKRGPNRVWPKAIVEIPSARIDPRSDPQVTQKITREQLDEALKRTKSGTRPVTREPRFDSRRESDDGDDAFDAFPGPRDSLAGPLRESHDSHDDAPQITIVRIDSMEIEAIDPSSLPGYTSSPSSSRLLLTPQSLVSPVTGTVMVSGARPIARASRASMFTQRLRLTPRMAFIAGVALAVCLLLAVLAGFFAGRLSH
jgi:hypothetical protein